VKRQRTLGPLSVAVAIALLGVGLPGPARLLAGPPVASIDPAVSAELAGLGTTGTTSVIVVLRDRLDPASVPGADHAARLRNIVVGLQAHAIRTQTGLRAMLSARQATGQVTAFTPLWIQNAIAVTGQASVIDQLALRPEVASILPDRTIPAPAAPASTASAPASPNVGLINAPALWSLGFVGQGVVIASMDTGVDTTHADIAARWRGGTDSWYDPYGQHATPTDVSGHGTWTMGLMVGGGDSGSAIGVAPGATWIAAKIFNDSGTSTSTAIHLAYQWLLDPDGSYAGEGTPAIPGIADLPRYISETFLTPAAAERQGR